MRIVLVILILGIVLGAYLFYVRGGGVQPELGAPQVIERQGGARTYAWTRKVEMPTAATDAWTKKTPAPTRRDHLAAGAAMAEVVQGLYEAVASLAME
jgi:hypothetical protein